MSYVDNFSIVQRYIEGTRVERREKEGEIRRDVTKRGKLTSFSSLGAVSLHSGCLPSASFSFTDSNFGFLFDRPCRSFTVTAFDLKFSAG